MSEANKRKLVNIIGYIIVGVMVVIFIIQRFSPADFGKIYGEQSVDAVKIDVYIQDGDMVSTFSTEDPEMIEDFDEWVSGYKLKYRTLADTMTPKSVTYKEYSLIPTAGDGTMTVIGIDERGLVRINARVYKVAGSLDKFFDEFETIIRSW